MRRHHNAAFLYVISINGELRRYALAPSSARASAGPETDVIECARARARAMGTMSSASVRTIKIAWFRGVGSTASCVYTKSDSALNHHAYVAHAPRAAQIGRSHAAYHGCIAGKDHNSAVIDRNSSALQNVRAYRTIAASVTSANAARITSCT